MGNLQLISLTLPLLRKGNMKKIFAMTSGNGVPSCIRQLKLQGRWPYATTKGALDIALIRLSNELHSEGFTVVSISPAVVFDRTGAEEKGSSTRLFLICVCSAHLDLKTTLSGLDGIDDMLIDKLMFFGDLP